MNAIKRVGFGALAALAAFSINLPTFAADAQPTWAADFDAGKLSAAKSDNTKAKEQYAAALKAAEAAKDDMGIAQICDALATVYMREGDVVNATTYAKRGKDVALKILMGDPKFHPLAVQLAANEENGSVWINHMMRGQLACDKKDWPAAEAEFDAAVKKAREYAADGMPTASALAGLGRVYVEEGKYKEAEPVLKEAIALCEKNWTPVTKSTAVDAADAMDHLAVVMNKTDRADEGTKLSTRAKEVRETQSLKKTDGAAAH